LPNFHISPPAMHRKSKNTFQYQADGSRSSQIIQE
jgi:hypothetical protein